MIELTKMKNIKENNALRQSIYMKLKIMMRYVSDIVKMENS